MPAAIGLSESKVGAIINTSSGGFDSESEQKMSDTSSVPALLSREFGVARQTK
jgi:hypothetical protein